MNYHEEAEKILTTHLENIDIDTSEKAELLEHSKRVCRICEHLVEDLGLNCNMSLLVTSAMLHDIAKYDEDGKKQGDHHEEAKETIKEYTGKVMGEAKVKDIGHVIKRHKKKFNPKRYATEAAVLRMADKLDKFNKYPEKVVDNLYSCIDSAWKIFRYFLNK